MRLAALSLLAAMLALDACSGSIAAPPSSQQSPAASPVLVTGSGSDPGLDDLVVTFMMTQRVANAQLAVSRDGKTTFSHAYTFTGLAESTTTTKTIMRLASNTKAWTEAALYKLIRAHEIDVNAKVFAYLGLTKPLPRGSSADPRVKNITIEEMIENEPGWDWDDPASGGDPSFEMRETALALDLTHHIDPEQYVRYQLHYPLQANPGTLYRYCNYCYDVLGMVVAKAAREPFIEYLQDDVSEPSGGGEIAISPTVGPRLPGEVAKYYSTLEGLSAVDVTSDVPVPAPYGGDGGILEIAQGDGGAAASAQTMLALMNHYDVGGLGPPPPRGQSSAREGEIAGTSTVAEQLADGTNFAFDINTNQFARNPKAFAAIDKAIAAHLTAGTDAAPGRGSRRSPRS